VEARTDTPSDVANLAWIANLASEGKYIAAAEAAGQAFEAAQTLEQRFLVVCEWEDLAFAMRPTGMSAPHPTVAGIVPALGATLSDDRLSGAQRAILLARLAKQESWPDPSRPVPCAQEGLTLARTSGDQTALIHALFAMHQTLDSSSHLPERLALSEELVRTANTHPLATLRAAAAWRRHIDCLLSGDSAGWEHHLEVLSNAAEESANRFWQTCAVTGQATRELLHGNYERAEALLPQLLEASRSMPGMTMTAISGIGLLARYQRGRGSTEGLSRMFSGARNAHVAYRIGMAYYLATSGRASEAAAEIGPVDLGTLPDDAGRVSSLCMALELACVYFNDREMAATALDQLKVFSGQMAVTGDAMVCWGPVSYYIGVGAAYLGNVELARPELERARKLAAAFRARPSLARALVEQGKLCANDDPEASAACFQEALAIAERIGFPAIAMAAREGLRAEAAPRARASRSSELTAREREILALVARGLTAAEVARDLVLSPRTVEKHLEHAYSKIGARNRAEGISWAIVNGLTQDP
jgi:DNA-binding CsgD family transcriptional regulator